MLSNSGRQTEDAWERNSWCRTRLAWCARLSTTQACQRPGKGFVVGISINLSKLPIDACSFWDNKVLIEKRLLCETTHDHCYMLMVGCWQSELFWHLFRRGTGEIFYASSVTYVRILVPTIFVCWILILLRTGRYFGNSVRLFNSFLVW